MFVQQAFYLKKVPNKIQAIKRNWKWNNKEPDI